MTRAILASAALYWYLMANGQDRISLETAAKVLGGTEDQVAKLELDERLHMTAKYVAMAGRKQSPVRDVFEHWVRVMKRDPVRTKLNAKRESRIRARLREGYPVGDLLDAIDGALLDDWLTGRDPRTNGKSWLDLDTVLRDGAQVEKLRDLKSAPAVSDPTADAPSAEWSPPAVQRERFVCWHCGCDDSYPHTPPSGMPGPPVCKACFTHVRDYGALPVSRETEGMF
jgi:hypothetical protein